jgi:hypothetical protein
MHVACQKYFIALKQWLIKFVLVSIQFKDNSVEFALVFVKKTDSLIITANKNLLFIISNLVTSTSKSKTTSTSTSILKSKSASAHVQI